VNIGLALSGGGIRGVAHIGAIKALEESGIFPTHIAGTSAGAVVGAFYSAGIGWEEMLNFFKAVPIFHIQKIAIGKPGIIDSEKFYPDFLKLLPENDFGALKKPLYVTATDIVKGTLKIFQSGELIGPILASASFPGIFTPIRIEDSHYIDGGVLNNFPIEPLVAQCDKLIGVYVNPLRKIRASDLRTSLGVAERAYKIKLAADSIAKFDRCNFVVGPSQLNNYGTFNMRKIDTIFNIGYLGAKKALDQYNSQNHY
tara:strand:- start:10251 stop:11018 length:768 start_codon:yes stop_codon:yes gene_type:complete